jgi:hypothetical protein
MGEIGDLYKVLVGKPEGKRPLGTPRCRGEDNVKIDLQDVRWEAWTGLIWLRIGTGGPVVHKTPSGSIKCKKFLDQLRAH